VNFSDLKLRMRKALHDFIYGAFIFGPLRTVREQIISMDLAFMTMIYGDMLGLPVVSPMYKYKLLPYFLPLIETWKKSMLKESDITEKIREG